MFDDKQKAELAKPLDRDNVAHREQGGKQLSYVEAWHVIAEANRIFGFDAWNSETTDLRCIAERERKIGRAPNQRDGWGVSYLAKVRVTVGDVVREGTGVGHGIDVDIGQAHESASKEAESDARKRCLMTFGNQFGLALYDKAQTNVVAMPVAKITDDQRDIIMGLAPAAGLSLQVICEHYDIAALPDLPASKFADCRNRLDKEIAKARKPIQGERMPA